LYSEICSLFRTIINNTFLSNTIMQGIIKFYNESKGYGFITDDESKKDYFVHSTGLQDKVQNNDKVTFELAEGKRGLMAVEVKVIR